MIGSANWSGGDGTGYYPHDLKHTDLAKQLLMYGFANPGKADIPLYYVKGYENRHYQVLTLRSVSLNAMTTRSPRH